jgi:hypothetical protein
MTTTSLNRRDGLDAALKDLLGDESVPEWVTAAWVAEKFGLNQATVLHAAKVGKLPTARVLDSRGNVAMYSIRPGDALLVWGYRLLKRESAKT